MTTIDPLRGARVMLVEDDFLILSVLQALLIEEGAVIIGGCRTVAAALQVVEKEHLSGAVLDLRVGRESVAPVARALAQRQVPFVFYTGQMEIDPVRTEWPDVPIVPKPSAPEMVTRALRGALGAAQ